MKFLDLFSGIGGFRLGMEQAGHKCIGYVEWDKFARKSYESIHDTKGEWTAHDITTVSDESIRGIGNVDVITGGFPCQAFSVAGKRGGFNDTRGTLFFEVARFANILRPRYLFLENVTGLLNHEDGNTFETIIGALDEIGNDHEYLHGAHARRAGGKEHETIKPKDLVGIPWMVAFALRADGWYLRSDIIWHKPNPMPESVTDRPTKAHEYIFLFSKSKKYYYDHEAIKENISLSTQNDKRYHTKEFTENRPERAFPGNKSKGSGMLSTGEKRNKRSVWTVTTKPYSEAHFATYPPELIKPCILAGCPVGGTVLDPFGGSGTTKQVANENNRECILIELNPDYIKLIEKRTKHIQPTLIL
jgi:hypothetical protein